MGATARGLRHVGGDAGSGAEHGSRVIFEDPDTGLGVERSVRRLVTHGDSNDRE